MNADLMLLILRTRSSWGHRRHRLFNIKTIQPLDIQSINANKRNVINYQIARKAPLVRATLLFATGKTNAMDASGMTTQINQVIIVSNAA